ncbi:GNAT family N-acetyltransferase [Aquibacillus sediminis]|uniref:GNAT family N-acetyltransferase n=1 Tax=Aquibacillus sediminis TaxID=2574734 RepID=UPI00110806DB|nr:GNAT family N-acetyltransferase [Aquibacillus sediminis]
MLATNRIMIEPVNTEEGYHLLQMKYKNLHDWPPFSLKALLPFYLEQINNDPSVIGYGPWLIKGANKKELIGSVSFKGKPNSLGEIDIGYHIITQYRQKGYATEAVQLLTDWALSQLEVNAITASCSIDNTSSQTVLIRNNFFKVDEVGEWLVYNKSKNNLL